MFSVVTLQVNHYNILMNIQFCVAKETLSGEQEHSSRPQILLQRANQHASRHTA